MRSNKMAVFILLLLVVIVVAGCGTNTNGAGKANGTNGNSEAKSGAEPSGGTQSTEEKVEAVKLNLADISSNPVFRVAKSKGIFEKYGIEAELLTFATPAEGINALFIKQVDVGWGADFPILNAVSKGEYTIIGSTGDATDEDAAYWKLFVRDDIQQPSDLKGKKLSFLRGTFQPYLWEEFLAEHSVQVSDTELIGQGALDEAYVALKKGEIDATWVYGSAMAERFGGIEGVHELTDMSRTKVRIGSEIVVPNDLINNHPDAVTRFLQAIDESSHYIKDHPDEVAELLYKEVKIPKENVLKDLNTINWDIGFSQKSYDSLSRQKEFMVKNGIIQQDFDIKDKMNLDFLRKAVPDQVTYQP